MIYRILPLFLVLLFFIPQQIISADNTTDPVVETKKVNTLAEKIHNLYHTLQVGDFQTPNMDAFTKAVRGYFLLKEQGKVKKDFLTVIDFSLSSTQKRLWVIDMVANKVVMQSVVSHGRNSGMEFANSFSNAPNSFKSSLGFFLTGEVYKGKHGTSLKLDGLERGINHLARARAVVMHGADYASEKIIRQQGRLGRSLGCPAVPYEIHKELIHLIEGESCLFIYHPSKNYEELSKLVS